MAGRYGQDDLGRFLSVLGLILLIIGIIFRLGLIITLPVLALLVICYVRMFSRDYAKRYAENQKFLALKAKLFHRSSDYRDQADRDANCIFRCPKCGQKIRVPRGKGKIEITCPRCHTRFRKRS